MSKSKLNQLCIMCGKPPNTNINQLPAWIMGICKKSTSDSYKLNVIRQHIMDNECYENAEVPLTTPLLKMVNTRNWVGKDGNIKWPSFLHAAEGLTLCKTFTKLLQCHNQNATRYKIVVWVCW
jgi:hypothetical protein